MSGEISVLREGIKQLNNRIATAKRILEQEKIERYALLIAKIQISDSLPDDMTAREFADIAVWDAIGRRATEIEAQLRKQMGVVGVIDPSALEPKGE
jgi:hypothetical protein